MPTRTHNDTAKRLVSRLLLTLPCGRHLLSVLTTCYRGGKRFIKSLDPRHRDALLAGQYLELGHALLREGFFDLAAEKFGKAIELAPCEPRGYLHRGRALHAAGLTAEAYRDFRAALALRHGCQADDLALLHESLARLLSELGETDQSALHEYVYRLLRGGAQDDGDDAGTGFLPDKAETYQALIEAHDSLAEHAINTRGDYAYALRIYRRKHRVREKFAETFGLDNHSVLYLPDDWVRNIGHMGLLDFWVKMRGLGWRTWEQMVLVAPPRATANKAYLGYWKKYFTVITDPYLIRAVTPFANTLGDRVACSLRLPGGREKYFCEGMGVVQQAWEGRGRPPLLELTPADRARGWEMLARLGVPEGAWFVSLHVRSPGFHKEGASRHYAHRNADVRAYLPAIRHITERGGWVIRLGDNTMDRLPTLPGLVDYAHSPLKDAATDVFLCACCRFFVGVTSGMSHLPPTFGVPCALTNWVSNALPVYGGRDRFIPKLTWSDDLGRSLSFREALDPAVRGLNNSGVRLSEKRLRVVDNTSQEVEDLIEEMMEVTEGTATYSATDERLQSEYRDVARCQDVEGFSRIGRAFLRKYAHLLARQRDEIVLAG